MIISTSALLLAGAALISYDFFAAGRDLGSSTTVFAQIVADNATAAVTFNDQPAAVDILNSLRSEPSIVSSCIYKGVELFAERARVRSMRWARSRRNPASSSAAARSC